MVFIAALCSPTAPDQDYGTFFLAVFPRVGGSAAASEDRWLLSLITVVRNAKGSTGSRARYVSAARRGRGKSRAFPRETRALLLGTFLQAFEGNEGETSDDRR